ncbi:MAG: hypothetical protein AVDCRST_MAG06-579 [uncultured Nocardioides sp.]|uniref:Uncharacterized protein n=1 Tax=uncultured Nocardioides sp. TaxID=198441 RepID=A0A6J4N569_9ACTN|nr:MAG: hypothetical protein AVDCRST_MAG06-579 [uncultured Nocardioides sp.]
MVYLLLPLPVWGPALLPAAAGYHLRVRGRCEVCGLGVEGPA